MSRTGLRLITSLPSQFEILRCMRHPVFAELWRNHWRIPLKFAADDYLVQELTIGERKTCFLHHYDWLAKSFPEKMLRKIMMDRVTLFEIFEGGERYEITLHFSHSSEKEGELTLDLHVQGNDLYVISFTVVPGAIVKSSEPDVLLVTRVQGLRGEYRAIQQATKALRDVAPPALLMAALQGFADGLGIREVVGISAVRQSAYSEQYKEVFFRSYDEFFVDAGLTAAEDHLYRSPIPIPEKPIQDVKRGHKLRTKEKRALKREIIDGVRGFFDQSLQDYGNYPRHEQTIPVTAQPEA
ncbi:DUF535 family protein [Acidicapsa dinghuensis]|uniref:DUF535 family protein n=1 Tax=Acidicapsa dinghuensis TaxID=2218256 RepID=A0ABW1EIM0_9BACT|nr:DUF535 family protein [Acidicapsa dinghuensis]